MENNYNEYLSKLLIQKANWEVYINEIIEDFDFKLKNNQDKTIASLEYALDNYDKIKDIKIDVDVVASNSASIEIATKSTIVYLLTMLETNLHVIQKGMTVLTPTLVFDYDKPKMKDFNRFILKNNKIVLDQKYNYLWIKINSVYRPIRNAIVHNFSNISNLGKEKQLVLDFINKHHHLIYIQNENIWFKTKFIKEIAKDINDYMNFIFEGIFKNIQHYKSY